MRGSTLIGIPFQKGVGNKNDNDEDVCEIEMVSSEDGENPSNHGSK